MEGFFFYETSLNIILLFFLCPITGIDPLITCIMLRALLPINVTLTGSLLGHACDTA